MKEGRIGEIKRAIEHNKKLTTEDGYSEYDSLVNEHFWPIYDASLENFEGTLNASLPENYETNLQVGRLKKYIEDTLSSGKEKHNLTAVEFGGPGSQLFSGFTNNFFARTVGVCLKDTRSERSGNIMEHDAEKNHYVKVGNIMDPQKSNKLLSEVIQTIGTNKTDLIISRMEGALQFIDKDLAILDRIIRNWYKILNKNGLIFVQFALSTSLSCKHRSYEVKKWATAIKERFPEVDIQIGEGVLRLHKKEGAPEELPPATQLFK